MPTSQRVPHADISFRRDGEGDRAIVFVHGFLDDRYVWNNVIAALTTPGFETVQLDLAGMGDRAGEDGPFTYERLAADVGLVVDEVGKPFVIVGHSMGAPIAELVAAARPGRALGLVLLSPVPLAGAQLPDEAVERENSAFTGPVLIMRGAGDDFFTEEMVTSAVSPRFASAKVVAIEGAGHWPHLEQPGAVAAQLDEFLTRSVSAAKGLTAEAVRPQGWTEAFASKSAERFGVVFADDVVLEGTALTRPVEGREQVMRVMGTASRIYESLLFTREASSGPRTYLEWEATALGGLELRGVTVLTKDDRDQVVHAAVHHRPLGAALRFSAELRRRLTGAVDPGYFYEGEPEMSATC
jgi:pimeloyl-ACP methyl ester carboxylesterase